MSEVEELTSDWGVSYSEPAIDIDKVRTPQGQSHIHSFGRARPIGQTPKGKCDYCASTF